MLYNACSHTYPHIALRDCIFVLEIDFEGVRCVVTFLWRPLSRFCLAAFSCISVLGSSLQLMKITPYQRSVIIIITITVVLIVVVWWWYS